MIPNNRYLLDTDVLIEYLRGQEQAVRYVDELEGDLLVSAITVAELYAGARTMAEAQRIDEFILAMSVLPVDHVIARQGGLFRQQYGQSHGTGLLDALIAATAEKSSASLITFNRRHFPMASSLLIPYER